MNYFSWISDNYPDKESCKNKCVEATLEMQKVFPELIRVRGHYEDVMFGSRPHWWLKTPDGKIVDPTAKQFSVESWCMAGLDSDYTEQDEDNVPTGKCIECGEYAYNHKCFCGDECNKKCGDRMNRTYLAYTNYGRS